MRITAVDHVVLNVSDVEKSLAFYVGELGLSPERVDEWRRREVPFPSARVSDSFVIDLFEMPRTGENSNHICFAIEPTDLDALVASGRFDVLEGPVDRWGARGIGRSIYITDPDGNRLELRYYPPR